MEWANGIFGMLPEEEWLSIPFQPIVIPNDPIDRLFRSEKTDNIAVRWNTITAEQQLPAMAKAHAFDTEADITARPVIDSHYVEKALIKAKINQSESLRAKIESGVRADQSIRNYILGDAANLVRQVDTRIRVAKNTVLATGKMTFPEISGGTLDFDFIGDAHRDFTINLAKTADIPSTIRKMVDDAADRGIIINGMLCARSALSKMKQNEAIQIAVNGVNAKGVLVTDAQLRAYLSSEFGITDVQTQDGRYNANNTELGNRGELKVVNARYYPEDKISFFATQSNGYLGAGLYGNPPSVTDPLITTSTGNRPYVTVSQWTENDPAVLWTKAEAIFIPVLFAPDSLFIATVSDGA